MSNLKNFCQSLSKKALQSVGVGVATTAMALGAGAFAESASAVTIGGVELSDDGFATSVSFFNGTSGFVGTNGDIFGSLTDTEVETYTFLNPGSGTKEVDFSFANPVLNGSGFDLALFDVESIDTIFRISADFGVNWFDFGVRDTGFLSNDGDNIYVAEVNLDDLGINPNATLDLLTVEFGGANSPSLALVGTIQRSVPEPSAMFGVLATIGFLAYQRGLKFAKKA
jgi:hypothetical protein